MLSKVAKTLEFCPEYNAGPLWTSDGRSVDLGSLRIPRGLRERLADWNARYDDSKLPFELNDIAWLCEGTGLLAEVRDALTGTYTVIVTEPWWGAAPDT